MNHHLDSTCRYHKQKWTDNQQMGWVCNQKMGKVYVNDSSDRCGHEDGAGWKRSLFFSHSGCLRSCYVKHVGTGPPLETSHPNCKSHKKMQDESPCLSCFSFFLGTSNDLTLEFFRDLRDPPKPCRGRHQSRVGGEGSKTDTRRLPRCGRGSTWGIEDIPSFITCFWLVGGLEHDFIFSIYWESAHTALAVKACLLGGKTATLNAQWHLLI